MAEDPKPKLCFHNAILVCGEARAVGNYFGGSYRGASYISITQGFNIATSNIALSPDGGVFTYTVSGNYPTFVRWDNNLP